MSALDIVNFSKLTFKKIPDQDNPVFDTTKYTGEELRVNRCLLICKVGDAKSSGVGDGFVVIYVPISGEIISKGKFWSLDMASAFAISISDYNIDILNTSIEDEK